MAPREDGQLFSEGMYPGINNTQKPSLLPGLNAGWRDLGGLALTLALEKAAIGTEKGSDASGEDYYPPRARAIPLQRSLSDLLGSDVLCPSTAQKTRARIISSFISPSSP